MYVAHPAEQHARRLCDSYRRDAYRAGTNEKGIDKSTGRVLVEVDPKYFRPCEVEQLLGDPAKAKEMLGWNPTKTPFPELVRIMVEHDMRFVKKLHLKAEMDKS